jgi:uncharacterized protein YabE (DUF348 family)
VLRSIVLGIVTLVTGSGLVGLGTDLAFGKDITVLEDGAATQVSVLYGSVAEVLAGQGVRLAPHDEVSPSLNTVVADGTIITVRHGRPILLALDGEPGLYWSTATTTADLVADLGLNAGSIRLSTALTTPIPRQGLILTIDRGRDVSITADGLTQTVHAFGTVADALRTAAVTWDDDDLITPAVTSSLTQAETITLVRVEVVTVERTIEIPFETIYEDDGSLYEGQSRVKSAGTAGTTAQTLVQTFHDGGLVTEVVTAEQVVSAPVTQVTARGTQARPVGAAPAGVWAALAQCESGGNPSINTGNGYYGLYQFSLGTWRSLGGTGLPSEASAEEQTQRAQALQARSGWGQWPGCASRLGLY